MEEIQKKRGPDGARMCGWWWWTLIHFFNRAIITALHELDFNFLGFFLFFSYSPSSARMKRVNTVKQKEKEEEEQEKGRKIAPHLIPNEDCVEL